MKNKAPAEGVTIITYFTDDKDHNTIKIGIHKASNWGKRKRNYKRMFLDRNQYSR